MRQRGLRRSGVSDRHRRGIRHCESGVERGERAIAVVLRLVRAVMVARGMACEAIVNGRARRDGKDIMLRRGHPPGWNKRTQEQCRREQRKDRELRPADHRRLFMREYAGLPVASAVRNQFEASSAFEIAR